MPYPVELVNPMRQELVQAGAHELRSADEVNAFFAEKDGLSMLVINSICGCAAGQARPGIRLALRHPRIPDRVGTVFAGQDIEATARARNHFSEIPPSSPSIALFKEGELVHFVPRHKIEAHDATSLSEELTTIFDHYAKDVR